MADEKEKKCKFAWRTENIEVWENRRKKKVRGLVLRSFDFSYKVKYSPTWLFSLKRNAYVTRFSKKRNGVIFVDINELSTDDFFYACSGGHYFVLVFFEIEEFQACFFEFQISKEIFLEEYKKINGNSNKKRSSK